MTPIDIGEIHWSKNKLQLIGWTWNWEDQAHTDFSARRAQAKCAIELMLDNCGIGIESERIPFDVERLSLDAIGYAAVTSSPAMWREYEQSQKRSLWERVTDWWLR